MRSARGACRAIGGNTAVLDRQPHPPRGDSLTGRPMKPSILRAAVWVASSRLARLGAATRHGPGAQTHRARERPLAARVLDDRVATEWGLQPQEWALPRADGWAAGYLLPTWTRCPPWASKLAHGRRTAPLCAELQVQVEARRVEKLLAYQRAYDEAWQRLNPGMQRVNLPDDKPGAGIQQSLARRRQRPAWRCSSGRLRSPRTARSACNPRARSSTCTWWATARMTRASATGPSARRSTRRACGPAASRSTTTVAAGCRWACPAICPPPRAK